MGDKGALGGGGRLSDNVGFATLKDSLPISAASLMDYTRDTLRRAKEIAQTLEEADQLAEEAWRRSEEILQETAQWTAAAGETSQEEQRPGGLELALVQSHPSAPFHAAPGGPPETPKPNAARPGSPKEKPASKEAHTAGGRAAAAMYMKGESAAWESIQKDGREGRVLAAEMREQITSSVMWVQQLLELVNTAESTSSFGPGESLKKPTAASLFGDEQKAEGAADGSDRNLPKLKEMALSRSQEKYQEKKADEQAEEDALAASFRNSALTQVLAKASAGRRA